LGLLTIVALVLVVRQRRQAAQGTANLVDEIGAPSDMQWNNDLYWITRTGDTGVTMKTPDDFEEVSNNEVHALPSGVEALTGAIQEWSSLPPGRQPGAGSTTLEFLDTVATNELHTQSPDCQGFVHVGKLESQSVI
jgi:hypothetical protein